MRKRSYRFDESSFFNFANHCKILLSITTLILGTSVSDSKIITTLTSFDRPSLIVLYYIMLQDPSEFGARSLKDSVSISEGFEKNLGSGQDPARNLALRAACFGFWVTRPCPNLRSSKFGRKLAARTGPRPENTGPLPTGAEK